MKWKLVPSDILCLCDQPEPQTPPKGREDDPLYDQPIKTCRKCSGKIRVPHRRIARCALASVAWGPTT
jgi:hypothetical protein